ncbi:galanin receptor type 1-like [Glandiceps talaboti]
MIELTNKSGEFFNNSSRNTTGTLHLRYNNSAPVANDSSELWFVPPGPPPMEVWLPVVTVYSVTFIVGLIGNVLAIFAIQRCRRLQNVTNAFLASLATADLILIVIVIPIQTPSYFSWRWELGEFMCKMLSYLTLLSSSCSVFMLTAMSIERYFVIIHPLKAKSVITLGRARKAILIIWIYAILYSFPPLYFKRQFSWDFPNYPTYHTCATYWPNETFGKAYSLYLLLGMYIGPLFIMVFCYSRIVHELWRSARVSKQMQLQKGNDCNKSSKQSGYTCLSKQKTCVNKRVEDSKQSHNQSKKKTQRRKRSNDQNRKQVIAMLLVVVAVFMICWGPLIWLVFLIEFGYVSRYSPIKTYLAITFNLLSYLSSCMNPICYAFISRTFRECFYWACRTCCRQSSALDYRRSFSSVSSGLTMTSTTTNAANSKTRPETQEEKTRYNDDFPCSTNQKTAVSRLNTILEVDDEIGRSQV